MAAINFPTSPNVNDVHTENNRSWKWNGSSWVTLPTGTQAQGVDPGLSMLYASLISDI